MGGPECAVTQLGLPKKFVDFLKNDWGIEKLHPPQAEAMPSILEGNNTMVCIPTASGKSLVAFMGIVNQLMVRSWFKAIYIVPIKGLASEKLEELKEIGAALGLKIGLGIGDAPSEAKANR